MDFIFDLDRITKLTESNYFTWNLRMKNLLFCLDLYDPVKLGQNRPVDKTPADWEELHERAVATIMQCIGSRAYHLVAHETDAQKLWKKLQDFCQKKSVFDKLSLLRSLINLKYSDREEMTEYIGRFLALVHQLASIKIGLDDEVQALLLLNSLPESWGTFLVVLTTSAGNDKLTFSRVQEALLNEACMRNFMRGGDSSSTKAPLFTEDRRRGRERDRGERGSSSKSRGRFTCYHCGKPGHLRRNCWALKRQLEGKGQKAKNVRL